MMGVAVFVGAVLANPNYSDVNWLGVLFGFLTGFTLTGASMAINDYYDREIDAVNEPSRPIPSGLVSPREVLSFVLVFSVVGLVLAVLVSALCLAVAVVSWVVVIAYVTVGKRSGLPGNLLVSVCVATPFVYGSVIVVGSVELNVWFFVSMAFLANTGREITKGIVDVVGDRAEGVHTLAVRFGERAAAVAAVAFYAIAVALTPVPLLLRLVSLWFAPFVLATDVGLIGCSVLLLMDFGREKARKIKNAVLVLFVFGLLAFVLGVLV